MICCLIQSKGVQSPVDYGCRFGFFLDDKGSLPGKIVFALLFLRPVRKRMQVLSVIYDVNCMCM